MRAESIISFTQAASRWNKNKYKGDTAMKKIMVPVLIVIAVLLVLATVLSKTNSSNNASSGDVGYHTHADGSIHYDEEPETTYHVHEDGVTHYDEH